MTKKKNKVVCPDQEQRMKEAANAKVRESIKSGKLIRLPCEKCGAYGQAHHDSYKKEDWLKVRFLCRNHHAQWHALKRKEEGSEHTKFKGCKCHTRKVTIRLTTPTLNRLKQAAKENGCSLADVIRGSVENAMRKDAKRAGVSVSEVIRQCVEYPVKEV